METKRSKTFWTIMLVLAMGAGIGCYGLYSDAKRQNEERQEHQQEQQEDRYKHFWRYKEYHTQTAVDMDCQRIRQSVEMTDEEKIEACSEIMDSYHSNMLKREAERQFK